MKDGGLPHLASPIIQLLIQFPQNCFKLGIDVIHLNAFMLNIPLTLHYRRDTLAPVVCWAFQKLVDLDTINFM